jgi:tRNA A37 threonylcarbamoyladenosine synthetase subunit TsaC/SUA5/YrdC
MPSNHIVDLIIEDGSAPGSEVSTIVDLLAMTEYRASGFGLAELQQWL